MNKTLKKISFTLAFILIFACTIFSGCTMLQVSVVSIEKTSSTNSVDVYTITYSDGSTSTFTVTNGKDGTNATSITVSDLFEEYKAQYGDITYDEFLKLYLATGTDDSATINKTLQSSLKFYSEFYTTTTTSSMWGGASQKKSVSVSSGSGVIYKIDDSSDGYVYVLTNYHVVYSSSANSDNGSNLARKVYGYLYGSESEPTQTSSTDENGYVKYNYGDYAISFEYVGGAIEYDLAVLRAKKTDVFAINQNVKAITFADSYYVGETAYAIGNAEDEGISVTKGIVSVDNEYITLDIDGTSRQYRSIRIDTALYEGNSGGGLFNKYGQLIGITNAGDKTDENINYAIPVQIVKNVVENILDYYDGSTASTVKKFTFGITVSSTDSKYVYDAVSGYGKIKETINIQSVSADSVAQTIGLKAGDVINAITINGKTHAVDRYFEIGDLSLAIRTNDTISITYVRDNQTSQTQEYTVVYDNLT